MAVELVDDPLAGQTRIETGKGHVRALELLEGKRNAKVTFKATHVNLTEPVTGWVDTHDANLLGLLEDALSTGVELDYKIVVHRKRGVEVDRAIAELGNREKVRDLVEVAPAGQMPRIPGSPVAGAANAPVPAPSAPQPVQGSAEPQTLDIGDRVAMTSEEADALDAGDLHAFDRLVQIREAMRERREGGSPVSNAPADRPTVTKTNVPRVMPADTPAPAPRGRRQLRTEEARPWERYNSDGSVNLGSYEVQATSSMASLAYEILLEKARAEAAKTGAPLPAPTEAQIRNLGGLLLGAADRAQAAVRTDGHADRMDGSHARARGAVRTAIDAYPVPFGASPEERFAWQVTVAELAATLVRVGVFLLDLPLPDPPLPPPG